MKDYQDSKIVDQEFSIEVDLLPEKTRSGVKLSQIKTLDQIVASYYVMEAITSIRGENTQMILEEAKKMLPTLNTTDERSQRLYKEFAEVVNYTPVPILMAKVGLELMNEMDFGNDPSVVTGAKLEVGHLVSAFGNNYTSLANVNLLDHTLNVFEEGINKARGFGRVMQVAIPTIACLFHDFGKSTNIRLTLIGDSAGRGYRPHAEVSEIFVSSMLPDKMKKADPESQIPTETIKLLSSIVKHHHPGQKGKVDSGVAFVIEADANARNKEVEKMRNV